MIDRQQYTIVYNRAAGARRRARAAYADDELHRQHVRLSESCHRLAEP